MDKDCTYCFELCDEVNKIVRNYPPSTIYLLSILSNKTLFEKDSLSVNELANKIGVHRPTNYNLKTIEAVL